MKIDRKSLAVHHAAGENGRYALNGVLLEPDGTTVATDGRMLLAVQPPKQGEDKETVAPKEHFVIPLQFAQDAYEAIPKGRRAAYGKFDLATITEAKPENLGLCIQGEYIQTMETKPENGDYPKWRDLMPSIQEKAVRFCLALEVLENLVEVLKEVLPRKNGGTTSSVEFLVEGPRKAILIRAQVDEDNRRMIGVLMPITWHGEAGKLTDWEKAHGLNEVSKKAKTSKKS